MKYALLIALREFAENAKTKGFWIGIFMLPLILGMGIGVSAKLARSEPSRYFIVVDKSAAFEEPINHSVEWEHQRSVLDALGNYVQQNLRAGQHPTMTSLRTRLTSILSLRPVARMPIWRSSSRRFGKTRPSSRNRPPVRARRLAQGHRRQRHRRCHPRAAQALSY